MAGYLLFPAFISADAQKTNTKQKFLEKTPYRGTDKKGSTGEKQLARKKIKSTSIKFLRKGKTKNAYDVLLKGLNFYPNDRTIRLLMAIAQCQAGKFDDAVYLLNSLIEENPSDAEVNVVLGAAYFAIGRVDGAVENLKRALTINPDFIEAHYDMAQILLSITPPDLEAARYHYKKTLDLGSKPDKEMGEFFGL